MHKNGEMPMTWEEKEPPWSKKKPATPEEMIAAFLRKLKESFEGGMKSDDSGSGGKGDAGGASDKYLGLSRIAMFVGAFFVFQLVYHSFYTIRPGERGVVLRFGKYTGTSKPGLNFMLPLVDEVIKVDVEAVRKEEFGFRTKVPGQKTVYEKQGYDAESLMLTGDKNVIDVEWIVQYTVKDPALFVFRIRDVSQTVRDVCEAAIRQVVGNHDFDYLLGNRDLIETRTVKEMQSALNSYESGVEILTVKLQDVNPPEAVKPAFNEVNEADQDMKRLVNEAEESYNRVIPKASGDAKRTIQEAQGYAVERVNLAKGETSRFLAVLNEYEQGKDVTRRRLYLETMEQVLPTVREVVIMDESKDGVLPFLDLGAGRTKK